MKYKIYTTWIICICIILAGNNFAHSYSLLTHKALTEKAVLISKVSDQTFLKDTLEISSESIETYKYFLVQGSIDEDTPVSRAWNHFHNPINNAGLNDMGQSGMSSVKWGLETESNEWSWKTARDFHYKAITGANNLIRNSAKISLFISLGHLVHLIEDGAQPEHVRNDAHPENILPFGFAFETWVETNFAKLNTTASTAVSFGKVRDYWDKEVYKGSSIPSEIVGITEYTNFNFLSKDTIFTVNLSTNNPHYFPYPRRSSVVDPITEQRPPEEITAEDNNIDRVFYAKKKFDGEIVEHFAQASYVARDLYTKLGITDYYRLAYQLDDIVYRDYSNLLLPKAISYSAGLLNYFFRGQINMEKDPNNSSQYVIKNESDEYMTGTFSLYYDDTSDNRRFIASWGRGVNAI